MKSSLIFACLCLGLSSVFSYATTLTVNGSEAQSIVGGFLAAGINGTQISKTKIYVFEVKGLNCLITNHGFVGGEDMGISFFTGCTVGANPDKYYVGGNELPNADSLANSIDRVAQAHNTLFYDGAAGKEIGQARSVTCTVNTDENVDFDKAYSCILNLED